MPVILTPAQARALGVDIPPPSGRRRVRAPGAPDGGPTSYTSICHDCGAQFDTLAAAERHVAPGHLRYDIPVTTVP